MSEKPIIEQKCPSCGAPMVFNPALNKLECEFCGTIIDIQPEETTTTTATHQEKNKALEQIQPLPVYNCVSCGAEVLVAQENGALTCPYCQNNIVLTNQFSGTIKPDGIVPFKITPDTLSKNVQKFYNDRPLLSKKFFSESRMGKVTGVYIPFWAFDCTVDGDVQFNGEKYMGSSRSGDYIITSYRQYRLERNVSLSFANLLVDASKKMDDALMDSVAPYNLQELKPFDIKYLAGYVADRFDQTSEEVQSRNDERVLNTASRIAQRQTTSEFSAVSLRNNSMETTINRAKYVLLPLYVFDLEFSGKTYHFAVNGQNGKVVGELPRDRGFEMLYYLKYFGLGYLIASILIIVFFII